MLGIEIEPLPLGTILRIENPTPVVVDPAGSTDVDLRLHVVIGGV
jgi:hypothetical protein